MSSAHENDQWADVYDIVHTSIVQDDIPFYLNEAQISGGPVLELGCGTGRITIPIAHAGLDITGIDYSENMLEVARGKLAHFGQGAGTVNLLHADMRDFELGEKFPLVIIPFNGFLSLLTVEDQIQALSNINRHIAEDGRLIFNIFVPTPEMLTQDSDIAYHINDAIHPETGNKVVLWRQSSFDHFNQIVDTRIIIEELDNRGIVKQKLYKDYRLRYSFRWEMHHLLNQCGYKVLELLGDFDYTPFDEDSSEMIWIVTPKS